MPYDVEVPTIKFDFKDQVDALLSAGGKETLPRRTWRDLPRNNTKLAIVGFAPDTREQAPWNDKSFDIWGLNEEYHFDWMKRFDLWFQIHPRWDYFRTNNMNHYNHPNWLKNEAGPCIKCNGTGKLGPKEKQVNCDECVAGTYTPPGYRADLPIIMQEQYDDIPNSIRFPLEEATQLLPLHGYAYFTSSLAYMLMLAVLMGYTQIDLYGFEMGTLTEYHYQRANAEYLIGLLQGRGIEINLPQASGILKGELYAYKNMRTGYRQNLEMRQDFLKAQERQQSDKYMRFTGQVEQMQALITNGHPELADQLNGMMAEYANIIGTHNVIKGALAEVGNLIKLYDNYFLTMTEEGGNSQQVSAEGFLKFTNLAYAQN